jgi:glycosyltransferase involved in cell wall biosynthesis
MQTGISVVIPIYNKESMLASTLDSVVAQTVKPDAVILIDDGSHDRSAEIAEAYRSRLAGFVLERQENAGVSIARNRGVGKSNTPWIAFLDADDLWHPYHVEALCRARGEHPEAGLIATSFEVLQEGASYQTQAGTSQPMRSRVIDYFQELAVGHAPVWTSSAMISRTIFDQVGGFPIGVSRGEDLIVWARAALLTVVAISCYVGAIYRRGTDTLSSSLIEEPDMAMTTYLAIAVDPDTPAVRASHAREAASSQALANALDALIAGRPDVARRFLPFSAKSRLYRWRHQAVAALTWLPAPVSAGLLRWASARR